jgi:hypothetical protein
VVRPRRRALPRVEALAAGGPRRLAAARLPQRLGRRPLVGGAMRNFPPTARRHAPPMSGCFGVEQERWP